MISTKLQIGMLVAYVIISVVALIEHKYPLALYYFGAAILICGVLWGIK